MGERLQHHAQIEVAKIYARPSISGKKSWTRSGDLKNAVDAPIRYDGETATFAVDVPYADRRHGLGVDWQPRNPAGGVVRRNPFFTDALDKLEPESQGIFERAVKLELRI